MASATVVIPTTSLAASLTSSSGVTTPSLPALGGVVQVDANPLCPPAPPLSSHADEYPADMPRRRLALTPTAETEGAWLELIAQQRRDLMQLKAYHEQQVAAAQGDNPFKTKGRGDTTTAVFRYDKILQELAQEDRDALRSIDKDGSGEVELGEMLDLEQEKVTAEKQVCALSAFVFFLIFATFLVGWAAQLQAQNTATSDGGLVSSSGSGDKLIRTAEAEQDVPLALSPLLSPAQFARVKEVTVTKMQKRTESGTDGVCPDCGTVVMQVEVAEQFNETMAVFRRTDGMEVSVIKGGINVARLPGQDPTTIFAACGEATCASIKVEGVDVAALKARAMALGYANTGRRGKKLADKMACYGAAMSVPFTALTGGQKKKKGDEQGDNKKQGGPPGDEGAVGEPPGSGIGNPDGS